MLQKSRLSGKSMISGVLVCACLFKITNTYTYELRFVMDNCLRMCSFIFYSSIHICHPFMSHPLRYPWIQFPALLKLINIALCLESLEASGITMMSGYTDVFFFAKQFSEARDEASVVDSTESTPKHRSHSLTFAQIVAGVSFEARCGSIEMIGGAAAADRKNSKVLLTMGSHALMC